MKYVVEAWDSRDNQWYVASVHTIKRKAERAVEDLEFAYVKARIREEA